MKTTYIFFYKIILKFMGKTKKKKLNKRKKLCYKI